MPLKLFTVLSVWHKRTEGTERIRWWNIRSSSIEADNGIIEGFSTLRKMEQEVLTGILGRFFTEEEADALKAFILQHMPGALVCIEPLETPVKADYLHQYEIDYRRQTSWVIVGQSPFEGSPLPDIRGSLMDEEEREPCNWEKPENWIDSIGYRMAAAQPGTASESRNGSVDSSVSMSLEEIKKKWPEMRKAEQIYFMSRYEVGLKSEDEDMDLIEFLMENVTPDEACLLPSMIMKLADRKSALRLIVESLSRISIEDVEAGEVSCMNHYLALEQLNDPYGKAALRSRLSEMFASPGLYTKGLNKYPGIFINYIAMDFVYALVLLCRMERKDEYIKLLGGFESHPNEDVARTAEACRKSLHRPPPEEGV